MQYHRFTSIALLCILGACSSYEADNDGLYGTTSWASSSIDDLVERENGRVFYDNSDLAVYQVELTTEEEGLVAEWRARWFDDNGMEIRNVARAWQIIHLSAYSPTPIKSVAPTLDGVSCRIEVRNHQPMGR